MCDHRPRSLFDGPLVRSPLTPPMTRSPFETARARGATVSHPAGQDGERLWARPTVARLGRTILAKQLRRQWKQATGTIEGRVENTFFRNKSVIERWPSRPESSVGRGLTG